MDGKEGGGKRVVYLREEGGGCGGGDGWGWVVVMVAFLR